MDLNGAKIKTASKYRDKPTNLHDHYDTSCIYYIEITVLIPGGTALYEIVTSEEINKSLETAMKLIPK